MQGHIRRRDAGSWEYTIDVGRAAAQRCQRCGRRFWVERRPKDRCPGCGGELTLADERRRETRGGYATRREAQAAMSKVAVAVEEQTHVAASRLTLREYLMREWLPAIEHTIRPTTYRSYVAHVECHILPALGSVQLQKLGPAQINALYAKLTAVGKRNGRVSRRSRCATSTPCFTVHSRTPCAGAVWRATRPTSPTRPGGSTRSRATDVERRAACRVPPFPA